MTLATAHYVTEFLPVDHLGHYVFLRGWIANESRPSVVVLHDLGESSDQYQNIVSKLFEDGFNAFSCDLRGHGQSGDRFNRVDTIAKLAKDLLQVASWIKFKTGSAPSVVAEGFSTICTVEFQRLWPKYCTSVILVSIPLSSFKSQDRWLWLVEYFSDIFPFLNMPLRLMPHYFRLRSSELGRPLRVSLRLFYDLKVHLLKYIQGKLSLRVPSFFIFKKKIVEFRDDDLRNFLFKDSLRSTVRWDMIEGGNIFTLRDGSEDFPENYRLVSNWLLAR